MNKQLKKGMALCLLGSGALTLSGCAAISTEIHHHKLTTESKMSKSIFLDPIPNKQKVIYVQVHNTSDKKIDLKKTIIEGLEGNGWNVTNDITKAHDMVQVNVLQAGKAPNIQSVWASMNQGYGNVLMGGFAGVAAGLAMDSAGAGLAVGGATSAIGWIADQVVEDVTYSMITDIRVSVRTDGKVTQSTESNLSQGTQSNVRQTYDVKSNWLRYQTRIASVADQVNLDFKDATPMLVKQTSAEIAGIFG